MTARVCVVGSANLDCVAYVERPPAPGETVTGSSFAMTPGGKGANAAMAAARAGGQVSLLGAIGDDDAGRRLLEEYAGEAIDTSALRVVPGVPTGVAVVVVDASGENQIVVVAGANGTVGELDRPARDRVAASDVLLLQLELPMAAVLSAARHARAHGVPVVLTPAPVTDVPDELLASTDVLLPNEHEARLLTGEATPEAAALALLARGVGEVVVTLGAAGALHVDRAGDVRAVAPVATGLDVVDTTGAGDAFAGTLAVLLGEGRPMAQALSRAAAAGALAVTRPGAATSPTRAEVEALLAGGQPSGDDEPGRRSGA